MGYVSFYGILGLVLYLLAAIIITGFVPNVLDIEPKSYKLKLMEKFSGPYETNTRLDKAVRLFENTLIGPESLALYKGSIYSGLHTGEIVRINGDKDVTTVAQIGKPCDGHWEPEVCGRPLGVRVTKDGILYGVDAYYGLYKVDLKTGAKTILVSMSQPIDGFPMKFPDDLAVDDEGVVYLSDASTKWSLDEIVYTVIEYCNRGRIIKYNPKTGQATAIMKELHFPNGVQLTHDGKALLVAELMKHRILKYNLEGAKKGTTEVFASVPGEPDNIRPSSSGGYWIGMVGARNATTPILPDYVSEYPKPRQVFARGVYGIGTLLRYIAKYVDYPAFKEFAHKFQKMWYNMWTMTYGGSCMVIELNKNGQVVQTLQSTDTRYCYVSEVLEKDGYLYLGSFINPYLIKVKL